MSQRLTPDICVIGGGSAGLTVAAAAAAFGVEVVLIERGEMGGECLNTGCVPSKALLAAAHHAHLISQAPEFGVDAYGAEVDFRRVHRHVRSVIEAVAPNDSAERFSAMGVQVIRENATFTDPRTVVAGEFEIRARRFVVATGSAAAVPAIPGLDEVPYLTNETLFRRDTRPAHLVVIGGGPVGLEMAQAHRRLGSAVTVIEAATALSGDDRELVAILLDRLRAEGVTILQQTRAASLEHFGEDGVRVTCEGAEGKRVIEGDALLVAAGRAPRSEGLGLEAAGIAFDRHGISVGTNLRTSNRRVYAIGDVVAGAQRLTHVANYHAGLVVQQILFRAPARARPDLVPRATYTDPELAHVGLSEAEARQRHGKVHVLRWPFAENDRAQAERRTEGLIKIVTDRKGRIRGVSILGMGAGEMINMWSLAVSKNLSVADVRGYVAPYPTMSEIGKRAALTYYAPVTRKPLVRRLVRVLARFG